MKICYVKKDFSATSLATIKKANSILVEYANQGYDLTLRQLYYQFVSRGLIPNKDTEYKKLGSIINDARLAGMIDWDHITDRTRNLRSNAHWDTPQDIITACAKQFQYDKWAKQENYVEVWVEKDALVGVLEVACKPLDVAYFSCRGYTSQSEMWAAAMRLLKQYRMGKKVHIIHLGDHDPSGVDMSRDVRERISNFMMHHVLTDWCKANPRKQSADPLKCESEAEYIQRIRLGVPEEVMELHRIALTMDQIREYNPPPNPAKLTDSRSTSYVNEYGDESWELDALEPRVLTELIQDTVATLRDDELWAEAMEAEETAREQLTKCADNWDNLFDLDEL
jgi:hypothetical protein